MKKRVWSETSDRLRKKIMWGVLGCLSAMGVMLLMPGTELKVQATQPSMEFNVEIEGITYIAHPVPASSYCEVFACDPDKTGPEVHIPAAIEHEGVRYQVRRIKPAALAKSSLKKITLEEGLEAIETQVFCNTQITEIEFPASVRDIGREALQNCTRLKRIRFRGGTPGMLWPGALKNIKNSEVITIQIPQGADEEEWKTALIAAGLPADRFKIDDASSGSSSAPSPSSPAESGGSIPEHVCQYEWETVREAGAGQDGLEQYLCKLCGSVQSTLTIPASQYQVQELYTKVTAAAEGETVTYDMGQIHTVCDKLFTKLQERSDVTLILTYRYKGADHRTTFPAGADYTELIEDEEQFYGMLGLNGRCGIVTE